MNKDYSFSRFSLSHNAALSVFALASVSGLLVGVFLAGKQTLSLHKLVSVWFVRPSPMLLLLTIIIPVVSFASALKLRLYVVLYPITFIWAVCRGLCGMLLYSAVGEGAWLARCLLMFSSGAVSVLTCWLFVRHCERIQMSFKRNVRLVVFLSVIVFTVDFFVISPLLFDLLMYF